MEDCDWNGVQKLWPIHNFGRVTNCVYSSYLCQIVEISIYHLKVLGGFGKTLADALKRAQVGQKHTFSNTGSESCGCKKLSAVIWGFNQSITFISFIRIIKDFS